MMTNNTAILLILCFGGLSFAVLSALENRVGWISSLCGFFGEGCKRTAQFSIFNLPISWWGIGYYLLLLLLMPFGRNLVFWAVMAGLGMELTFLWILLSLRIFCIFCALNALIVVLLTISVFDPVLFWEGLSVALLFLVVSLWLMVRENNTLLGIRAESRSDILAKVDGDIIREEPVKRPLAQKIHRLQIEIFSLKQKRLNALIRERLLEKEAESKEMSKEKLEASIAEKCGKVSEKEVECAYKEKGADYEGDEEEIREKIRKNLRKKKEERAINDYADSLWEEYDVEVFLEEPPLPITEVNVKDSPATGPADAPVVVVEFSDYLCPACRAGHETANEVKEKYEDQIRWVFKDFPLPVHEGADKLAEAAKCAADQGEFWRFQDLLFSSEHKPEMEDLKEFAHRLEMDVERFEHCLETGKFRESVRKDIEDAKKAGISATPTYIINGKMISGTPSLQKFQELIEEKLNA